jgi:hypothetical protein
MRDWLCVPHRAGAATLATLVLVAGGCSGDDDGGIGGGGGGGGGDGLESVNGALGLLPDNGHDQVIVWGDLARAADIAGLDRPDPDDTSSDAAVDYLYTLTGTMRDDGDTESPAVAVAPPDAAHIDQAGDLAAFTDDVGWNILEVDRFVERQSPPDDVTVLGGSFDDSALTDASGDAEDGTWVAGPGGEGGEIDVTDITPARPLGESLWLTLGGDTLTVTRNPDDSASATAAASGDADGDVLSADADLAGLAAALDEQSAYSAILLRPGINGAGSLGQDVTPEQAEQLCQDLLPEATTAVATGVTADDDGPVVLVALAHSSADAADANAEALETAVTEGNSGITQQPWSDMFTLDGVETTSDGKVAIARLRPTEPVRTSSWLAMVMQRDSLITSC